MSRKKLRTGAALCAHMDRLDDTRALTPEMAELGPYWVELGPRRYDATQCSCGFMELRRWPYGACPLCGTPLREATIQPQLEPWRIPAGWNADTHPDPDVTREQGVKVNESELIGEEQPPSACPDCGGPIECVGLTRFYCLRAYSHLCDHYSAIYGEGPQLEFRREMAMPISARPFSVGRPDAFYEETTALYRVPAALNWPRGRNNPKINARNEGKPRTHTRW